MYDKDKRSFFERLTGTIDVEEERKDPDIPVHDSYDPNPNDDEDDDELQDSPEEIQDETYSPDVKKGAIPHAPLDDAAPNEDEPEGELAVDVYEDGEDIYVQAMIAGVDPEDVDIQITREMVNLKGRRGNPSNIVDEKYFLQELYWGGFSRNILLPEEIDPERSQALEKNGLLILKLPKLNKRRQQKLEVKSLD